MNNEIVNMISTLGFPIVACAALGWFCKYMIDKNNENIDRMFQMYDKANEQNRTAIQDVTAAVNRLCDKLDNMR